MFITLGIVPEMTATTATQTLPVQTYYYCLHKNINASEAIVTVEGSIDKGKTWNTLSSIGMNESVETVGETQTVSWSFSEESYDDMLVRLSVSEDY